MAPVSPPPRRPPAPQLRLPPRVAPAPFRPAMVTMVVTTTTTTSPSVTSSNRPVHSLARCPHHGGTRWSRFVSSPVWARAVLHPSSTASPPRSSYIHPSVHSFVVLFRILSVAS
ncbi:hypothetical protein DAEQUDRAFT_580584 [Daedalea quercina L-15889]|uniref:Uncharacterized protein n=1 Tax=Daedalea quercina L-15889 TaxID=1314783 RepID=A0A165LSV4_9APHY|nr:hypothetical protein DAEQUDRAFT_580584 [Daedalea quercina L-15889]